MKSKRLTQTLLATMLAAASSAQAATNTWSASPSNGLWATTGNWSLNALNTADNIVFGSSSVSTISTDSRTIADLTFSSSAPAYTINGTNSSQILTLTQSGSNVNGIINNSANTQTLGVNLSLATSKSYSFGTNIALNSPTTTVFTGTTFFGGNGIQSNAAIINARGSNVTLGAVQSTAVSTAQTQALVLDGNTSGSKVIGVITNNSTGAALSTTAIAKAGTGTWSLSGANTYTGGTTVENGTLKLDFAASGAPTSNILYNGVTAATVVLSGGNLLITGKDSTANTQTLGAIQSLSSASFGNAGYGKSTLSAGGSGGTLSVSVTGISSNIGAALDFYIGANSTLTNSGATASTLLGQRIFFNGTDYAYYNVDKQVVASAGQGFGNGGAAITASLGTNNGSYFLISGDLTRTAALPFRGLRITSSGGSDQSLDLGGFSASANNGSILYAGGGTGNYTIKNGTLISDIGSSEIMVNVASGATLNIASNTAISNIDSTNTTTIGKVGDGTLVVSGAKAFTGKSYVVGGTLSFDSLANGGTNSGLGASSNAASNLTIGSTLKYTGAATSTDRAFTVGVQGATIDSSGTGALTWAPAAALSYIASSNSYSAGKAAANNSITFTGTNTANNTFGSATALLADGSPGQLSVTKSGTGKWILNQANTYTGGTTVTGGTLVFGNNFTMNGPNAITVAATGIAGTDYATVTSTSAATLTFAGTLNINLTASLGSSATFNLFQASGGTLAGSFTAVSVTGSYLASLTNSAGTWTGSGSGYDFSFAQGTGIFTATSTIPEPSTYAALAGLGVLGLAIYRRRKA